MLEKILSDFSGSWEPVRIFYIEINGNFIFRFTNFHFTNSFHRTNYVRKSRDGCIYLATVRPHVLSQKLLNVF
jgi:hypothetical protein